MSELIHMKNPLIEMDGDEMTRVIWAWIKETLLRPYIDLATLYFDLGLENRDKTDDQATYEAALATKQYGVAVKCATITPNDERMAEYGLKRMYPSPNATIRSILDGTVFRTPIMAAGMVPYVSAWKAPITIARHAYGDIYRASEALLVDEWADARVDLVLTRSDGLERRLLVYDFAEAADAGGADGKGLAGGVVLGMHNTEASIHSFARSCMEFALSRGENLWFSAKDTISTTYDRRFRDIFEQVYADEFSERFVAKGIEFFYTLIDDAVARAMRSEGGFIWATKNYDGDVMSDMVASAFGSLAMMSSVLVSPEGNYEYEAAHGTVQRHYYRWQAGEKTSTNPVAMIFAWTGALARRGELDGLADLVGFAQKLEAATLKTIASGLMTADLADISQLDKKEALGTEEFLQAIAAQL
ncbi:MAG: NADP-dependent isocitrate dehydrogenase [Coriobacteriia bacterium]|nr:NADP-dependent isocitrate dehydrogenase [Coriobacteriia bacterium]